MKKTCVLVAVAAASLLVFTGCDDSAEIKAVEPAAPAATSAGKKPAGVPEATYKKIKAVETQHNDQVEAAMKP